MLARNEVGVLALPAKAGGLPQRLFHHRGGIHEHLDPDLAQPAPGGLHHQPAGEGLQRLFHRVVVIGTLRIGGDAGAIMPRRQRQRVASRGIAHAQRDNALRLAPQRGGRAAVVGAAFHPRHFAVAPIGQPLREALGGLGVLGRRCHPASGKAYSCGLLAQRTAQIGKDIGRQGGRGNGGHSAP